MSCSNTGGRRRSRKMRGGNGYGFGAPIAAGALTVEPNLTSVVGGAPYKPMGGRRRRRRGGAIDPAGDLDVPPVVGDIVDNEGRKLFPEQQCVAAGREWFAAPYGYKLINSAWDGLLGYGDEILEPKNANNVRLGFCSGTSPPPNMQPGRPAFWGGRHRKSRKGKSRRSRRRTMRGGGSVSSVGAGFTGSGSRGIADYVGYESNVPVSGAFAIPTGTR